MEIIKIFFLIAAIPVILSAKVVESSIAPPINAKQKWQFLRKTEYFIQHRCTKKDIRRIDAIIQTIFIAESLSKLQVPPLQFRFYTNQAEYRRKMLFSHGRTGHYNEDRQMILSSCSLDATTLSEHVYFHAAGRHNLRPWQRIFVAEVRARSLLGKNSFFADAKKKAGVSLDSLFLSNHPPEIAERATMYRLALALDEAELLPVFIAKLLDNKTGDDTGLEILEKLFPEGIKKLR